MYSFQVCVEYMFLFFKEDERNDADDAEEGEALRDTILGRA